MIGENGKEKRSQTLGGWLLLLREYQELEDMGRGLDLNTTHDSS